MARGDRVEMSVAGARVTGIVIEVDGDLVSLRDRYGDRVDVRLDPVPMVMLRVVVLAAGRGCTPPLASGGFRGRLLAAETTDVGYSLQVRGEIEPVDGRIAVGLDHVDVVGDDVTTTVPLPLIAWFSSSRR